MPTTKTRKPKTAEAAPPVSNVPVFTKRNILTFQRYAKRRDFEDYLISFGVDTTLRTAGGPARLSGLLLKLVKLRAQPGKFLPRALERSRIDHPPGSGLH